MSLADLLKQPREASMPPLPSMARLQTGVARILARWPDAVAIPPDTDRDALVREMSEKLRSGRWDGTPVRRVLMAAQAAFDGERRERADTADLRAFLVAEVLATDSATFLGGMVAAYVATYVPAARHSRALGAALAIRRTEIGGRWAALLAAAPALLDATRAHADLAGLMAGMERPIQNLRLMGLPQPHAPGLMDAAHLAFVAALAPMLDRPEALGRLRGWLAPGGAAAREEGAREAIEAMLRPWVQRSPPEDLRRDLAEWIVAHYRDPRLHVGGVWSGFDEGLKAVMFRWLTEADMQFFCDVVTATQDSHMWAPRRDYWLRLFRQKRIDAAWVAFCPSAEDYARRRLMRQGGQGASRRFGRQEAGGGRADTSLLIMRIGGKVVVDGCHSYRTHIFDAGDRAAPRLFERAYDCDEIMRRSRNAKSHVSIPSWIDWVERNA